MYTLDPIPVFRRNKKHSRLQKEDFYLTFNNKLNIRKKTLKERRLMFEREGSSTINYYNKRGLKMYKRFLISPFHLFSKANSHNQLFCLCY